MTEKQEVLGQWWLPANPEQRWVGTLKLAPGESPNLAVIVPQGYFQLCEPPRPPVLHGYDEHGKPVTLLFPSCPSTSGAAALSQMRFSAGYAVMGIHLSGAEEFLVSSLSLGLQHLHEWSGLSGFVHSHPNTALESHVHYRSPEPQRFSITPDLSLEIGAAASGHTSWSERVLREDAYLSFESKAGLTFHQSIELINAFRQLLHFAVLAPVYPLWMTGVKDGHGYTVNDCFYPQEIGVFGSILRDRVDSEIQEERWVFRFPDVQPRFAQLFAGWLTFSRDFSEALSCYSATVYHRFPDSMRFLCLAQALEAYHGTRFGKTKFKQRVLDLTTQFLPSMVGLVSSVESFAEEVRHNRDFYTHHEKKIRDQGLVVSGADLHRLSEKLQILFQMCVLTELGVSSDRFVRLRRQLATYVIDFK